MRLGLKLWAYKIYGTFIKKINGPHVVALIAQTENGKFAVSPEDVYVGRALRMKGRYAIEEIERLKSLLTPSDRVLVVGAHIGTLAIPLAAMCKKVVAIEANPETYKLLRMNLELNQVSNCDALNIAASDKTESLPFLISRTNSGGSKRVPVHKEHIYYYDRPAQIEVPAHRLDDFLQEDFDAIIMDIEGSEYFAMQGMSRILSKARILAIEFLPHHLKNIGGVTVAQFLSVIQPHFKRLTIPTQKASVGAGAFQERLSSMYEAGQSDEGLIFHRD